MASTPSAAEFREALRTGDAKMVRELLRAGANPNKVITMQDHSEIGLARADVGDGNLEMAQLLLDHSADPNLRGSDGNTSLMLAADRGQVGVVELLLKHGADLDAVQPEHGTMDSRPFMPPALATGVPARQCWCGAAATPRSRTGTEVRASSWRKCKGTWQCWQRSSPSRLSVWLSKSPVWSTPPSTTASGRPCFNPKGIVKTHLTQDEKPYFMRIKKVWRITPFGMV